MIEVKRTRWIVTRNNNTEILCGTPSSYKFKKIEEVGISHIKRYISKKKAINACEILWINNLGRGKTDNFNYIQVEESLVEVEYDS